MQSTQTEYIEDMTSGLQHDVKSALCNENIRKMLIGVMAEEPLVQAYWEGYRHGLRIHPVMMHRIIEWES